MDTTLLTVAFGLEQFPLKIGKFQLSCFILEDHQAVILKSSAQKALGYEGKSENWLAELLSHIHKFNAINDLITPFENPIRFEIHRSDRTKHTTEGISPILFLNICKALKSAKEQGFLTLGQLKYSKAAAAILTLFSGVDLFEAINKSTGFNFFKENSLSRFQKSLLEHLQDDAFQWISTFPEDFFQKLFELHETGWQELVDKPAVLGKIVHDVVFSRVPESLLQELRNTKPKRNYTRKNNLPQETIHPQLKEYLSNILALIKASGDNWNIFLQLLSRSYPKNPDFTTKFPTMSGNALKKPELSAFNKKLIDMS